MKSILFFLGITLSFEMLAQGAPVPHIFNTGDPIVATEFNANFQELSERNDTTQTQVTQNASDVSGAQSDISTIQGNITQIQNDITSLQTNASAPLLQFVGNSTGTADGDDGIRSMTELCQADFPESRICTSEEYVKTTTYPASIPGATHAWILPGKIVVGGGGSTPAVTDIFSGIFGNTSSGSHKFSCQGWSYNLSNANTNGLSVSGTGQFSTRTCDNAQPVSCCK